MFLSNDGIKEKLQLNEKNFTSVQPGDWESQLANGAHFSTELVGARILVANVVNYGDQMGQQF